MDAAGSRPLRMPAVTPCAHRMRRERSAPSIVAGPGTLAVPAAGRGSIVVFNNLAEPGTDAKPDVEARCQRQDVPQRKQAFIAEKEARAATAPLPEMATHRTMRPLVP